MCLDHIGIKDCFDGIISFDCLVGHAKAEVLSAQQKGSEEEVDPSALAKAVFCKPDLRSFQYALERANAEAETTLFLDDSLANIKGAKEAGLQTVLVGKKELCQGADYAIENFLQLREAAPYLWQ